MLIERQNLTFLNVRKKNRAEPLKAKKRIDPQVLLARENRKRKKIEREVRRLERFGRRLKPVEEAEPDRLVLKEIEYACLTVF